MCGQNPHALSRCQPIRNVHTVSDGDVPPGSSRSGADRSRQKPQLTASKNRKAFLSSWAFFIARIYPSALSPAPNGNLQAATSADE
jgi:hypothetical protein